MSILLKMPKARQGNTTPACRSCSQRIALLGCALILESLSGFPMGLILVGGAPCPPPLPLPGTLFLCGVVAHNYHPLHWMTQCEIWDGCVYQCSKDVSM